MYYKIKPRTRPFKPLLRSSEEPNLKPKRRSTQSSKYRLDDDVETEITTTRFRNKSKRRSKGVIADMPFFTAKKKTKNLSERLSEYKNNRDKVNSGHKQIKG